MKQLIEKELSVLTIGTEILTKDLMDQYLRSLGPISTYYGSRLDFALSTYQNQHIDVVFCELNFSDGSVNQFIKQIGGLHYGQDLYFVVAHRDPFPELESLRFDLGIDEVLVKPFNVDSIKAVMERAVKKLTGAKPIWSVEVKVAWEAERSKRFLEAEKFFQRIFSHHMPTIEASLEVAKYWLSKARLDECEKLLEDLLEKNPDDVRVLDIFGRLMNRRGNPRRAMLLLEKAQKMSPINSLRAVELADTYLMLATDMCRAVTRFDEFDSEAQATVLKLMAVRKQYGPTLSYFDMKQNNFTGETAKEVSAFVNLAKSLGKLK